MRLFEKNKDFIVNFSGKIKRKLLCKMGAIYLKNMKKMQFLKFQEKPEIC